MRKIKLGDFFIGDKTGFVLIAGPCVLESEDGAMDIAKYLKDLTAKLRHSFYFQSLLR